MNVNIEENVGSCNSIKLSSNKCDYITDQLSPHMAETKCNNLHGRYIIIWKESSSNHQMKLCEVHAFGNVVNTDVDLSKEIVNCSTVSGKISLYLL